ncbi:hypothetical protein FRC07_013102, partial [Ceratobasidium sp. 392]
MASSSKQHSQPAPKPLVFKHHTTNQAGKSVAVQQKKNTTSKNRYLIPQQPAATGKSSKAANVLPGGVAVDDGLYWDFDDCAGEELPAAHEDPGSSDIEPQSAFTLATLDHFTLFAKLGKTSAHRYNSVLRRQTNTGFPETVPDRYRELLVSQRKFAFAKMLQRAGVYFQPLAGSVASESLALHCVACPRVGVNFFPDDVPLLERYFISFDGNFRNPRKAKKVDPGDLSLTDGRMYNVTQILYRTWIRSKKGDAGVRNARPECDNHKAAADKFAKWGGLDVTGIGACTCARHSLFLPAGMVDFDKGESWANVDFAIASAASAMLAYGLLLLAVTYDIFCHWIPKFNDRVKELPDEIAFNPVATDLNGGIPRFHAAGHIEQCRVRHSLNYLPYGAQIEGEGCERAWAYVNETAGSTSEKSPGARQDSINFICGDWNYEKVITTALFVAGKFKEAKRMYEQQLGVFTDLNQSLPKLTTAAWRMESTTPRKEGKVWTSPYFGKNDWGKDIQQVLLEEENREAAESAEEQVNPRAQDEENRAHEAEPGEQQDSEPKQAQDGLARWILKAIELENALDKLRVDAAALGPNSTPRQHNTINARRKSLTALVNAHRLERERFLGSLGDPDHPLHEQLQSADVEHAELGLPSSYEGASLIAGKCLRPARVEGSLRRAACDDALRIVRNLLGAKSLTLRYKRKNLTGERATTRAESQLMDLREKVERARRRYNRSRDALLWLDLLGSDRTTYPPLESGHLTMLTEYLENESAALGQGTREISWIWRAETVSNDERWMIDALKVEWFRARQRANQWREELMILKREIAMTLNTFQYEQRQWEARGKQQGLSPGMAEYATRKACFFARLAFDTYSCGTAFIKDPVVSFEWAELQWPTSAPPSSTGTLKSGSQATKDRSNASDTGTSSTERKCRRKCLREVSYHTPYGSKWGGTVDIGRAADPQVSGSGESCTPQ